MAKELYVEAGGVDIGTSGTLAVINSAFTNGTSVSDLMEDEKYHMRSDMSPKDAKNQTEFRLSYGGIWVRCIGIDPTYTIFQYVV